MPRRNDTCAASGETATVLYLRDGDTAMWPAGTDPVTGEAAEIRVTLKALK